MQAPATSCALPCTRSCGDGLNVPGAAARDLDGRHLSHLCDTHTSSVCSCSLYTPTRASTVEGPLHFDMCMYIDMCMMTHASWWTAQVELLHHMGWFTPASLTCAKQIMHKIARPMHKTSEPPVASVEQRARLRRARESRLLSEVRENV